MTTRCILHTTVGATSGVTATTAASVGHSAAAATAADAAAAAIAAAATAAASDDRRSGAHGRRERTREARARVALRWRDGFASIPCAAEIAAQGRASRDAASLHPSFATVSESSGASAT